MARRIADVEGGDQLIIDLAVMLHDVGDRKVIGKVDDDYSIAEDFLVSKNVAREIIDQIMYIIMNMSFSKTLNNKSTDGSLEFKVVQDADRLDAIGAVGVARAFTYGGAKNRMLHDPTHPPASFSSTRDYKSLESSTINHFEEKLFSIKLLLHTETAIEIAKQRHDYMVHFVERFLDEWDGRL